MLILESILSPSNEAETVCLISINVHFLSDFLMDINMCLCAEKR